MIPIAISYAKQTDYPLAQHYHTLWGYPLVTAPHSASIQLHIQDKEIYILAPHISKKPYLHTLDAYMTPAAIKQHPLSLAIGNKQRQRLIYDLTAGLLKDSIHMALLGHQVIAIEQHPVIFTLSAAAWHKQCHHYPDLVLRLHQANSLDFLSRSVQRPDIIYLDPMFPTRNKTALVKKPMQLLQAIVGSNDSDHTALLATACAYAKSKVIVKRPQHGQPISGPAPSLQLSHQQSTRYDIYHVS